MACKKDIVEPEPLPYLGGWYCYDAYTSYYEVNGHELTIRESNRIDIYGFDKTYRDYKYKISNDTLYTFDQDNNGGVTVWKMFHYDTYSDEITLTNINDSIEYFKLKRK